MIGKSSLALAFLIVTVHLTMFACEVAAAPQASFECDNPKGTSSVFDGGWLDPGASNDRSEGLSGTRVRFMRDGDVLSIEISNAGKVVRILEREHATVYSRQYFPGSVALVWATDDEAAKTVDTFIVHLNMNLSGTLIWQVARLDPDGTKVSTFTAACRSAE